MLYLAQSTILKCFLSDDQYRNGKWVGKGEEEFCSDPKLLNSKILTKLQDFIGDIRIFLINETVITIYGNQTQYFKPEFDRRHGLCYRVQANEIAPNVTIISFEAHAISEGFKVYAHSPNEKISLASKSRKRNEHEILIPIQVTCLHFPNLWVLAMSGLTHCPRSHLEVTENYPKNRFGQGVHKNQNF